MWAEEQDQLLLTCVEQKTGEYTNTLCYIYTMEHFTAAKKSMEGFSLKARTEDHLPSCHNPARCGLILLVRSLDLKRLLAQKCTAMEKQLSVP